MKLDDARVVVVSGAGEDQINGIFVQIFRNSSAQFPPKHLAVLLHRAQSDPPARRASSAAMSKQPVRVVIRNRPTQESADNIMLEKDGKTVTIRQSTATVGGGAKQARQQPLSV